MYPKFEKKRDPKKKYVIWNDEFLACHTKIHSVGDSLIHDSLIIFVDPNLLQYFVSDISTSPIFVNNYYSGQFYYSVTLVSNIIIIITMINSFM